MNSQWLEFLRTQSAELTDGGAIRFGEAPQFTDCALCDLSHLGLLAVEGEDAGSFLQGQLTNDTARLGNDRSQMSSICNPKGRMLANFRIFPRNKALLLQFPRELVESVMNRLRMYVLRSKVQLKDAGDELIRIGLAGDCAQSLLARQFPNLPSNENEVTHPETFTVIRIPSPTPRFEIIGPVDEIQRLWQSLLIGATPVNADFWALLDIEAGIPTVYPETVEAFIPQMANMQLVDGVSFTKGCYTGQEIVARMQYLGKLKRRMYLAHVDTDQRPIPGAELFSPTSESEQGAGRIVDARPSPDGGFDALVVVQIAGKDRDDVFLGESGPRLRFKELPYRFASEESEHQTQ